MDEVIFSGTSWSIDGFDGSVAFTNAQFQGGGTIAVRTASNATFEGSSIADTCIGIQTRGHCHDAGPRRSAGHHLRCRHRHRGGDVLLESTTISGCRATQPAVRVNDNDEVVRLTLGGPSMPVGFSGNHIDLAVQRTQADSEVNADSVDSWSADQTCTACRCTDATAASELDGVPSAFRCGDVCVAGAC